MRRLRKENTNIQDKLKRCENINESLNETLLDLEARSMRENLIFYGIQESPPPVQGQPIQIENCERLVKDLTKDYLKIDANEMTLDRAHRLGGFRAKKPRPVVVKFHQYSDRETIRMKSREDEIRTSLWGSNLGIGIQMPLQHREARRALTDLAKKESDRGKKTRIVGSKLFVNNKLFKKYSNGHVVDRDQDIHLLSWNINGLTRKLADPDFISLINNYDLIFLTETWLSKRSHVNLNVKDFDSVHLFRNKSKTTRRGRFTGGISVYFRKHLKRYPSFVEKNQNGIIVVKLAEKLFDCKQDVYIFCTYIPPNISNVIRDQDFNFFEQLETLLEKYEPFGKCFCIGDFNARTSNESDVIDPNPYIDHDGELSDFVNIDTRVSRDHVIDTCIGGA